MGELSASGGRLVFCDTEGKILQGEQVGGTHVDHREETVAFWPFGHATVSGLAVIDPPQAKPAHPSEIGVIISSTMSNAPDAPSGMAILKIGAVPPGTTCR